MGGLSRSHWPNTLGSSGLQILLTYENGRALAFRIKHLLFVLVGRSPQHVGWVLQFLISTKKREMLFLGVCIIGGVSELPV